MKLGTTLDVLVIGAGQAGLAIGYHLRNTSLRYQLLDGNARVGESWRRRYDSLVLFSPRAYSALPGLSVPGDPEGCPTKDEIADYLEHYARHFALPVVPNVAPNLSAFSASTCSGGWSGSACSRSSVRVALARQCIVANSPSPGKNNASNT